MKSLGWVLLTLLVVLILLTIGGALVLLAAYGLGLAVNLIADFESFQATILGLLAITVAGFLANRIWDMIRPPRSYFSGDDFDDDFDDEYDEYDEDFLDEMDEEEEVDPYPGIPRWRQPLKKLDFSNTKPDDRCPCGSGRKYKNCHGSKNKAN